MPTIACAAFVRNGEVLLAKRSPNKRHNPGQWDLIGGHVEPGEDPALAVVREAQEEVGLTPIQFELMEVVSKPDVKDGVGPVYRARGSPMWTGEQPELLGDEHTEIAWFPLSEVTKLSPTAHPYMPTFDWARLS